MGLSNQYAYPCCAATQQDPIDKCRAAVMSVTREVSEKYGLDGIFQKRSTWRVFIWSGMRSRPTQRQVCPMIWGVKPGRWSVIRWLHAGDFRATEMKAKFGIRMLLYGRWHHVAIDRGQRLDGLGFISELAV